MSRMKYRRIQELNIWEVAFSQKKNSDRLLISVVFNCHDLHM